MPEHSKSSVEKWKYSAIAGLLFFIIANPTVYKVVDKIIASAIGIGKVAGPAGCPTFGGLILHSLVYMLVIRLIMDAK